MKTLQEAIVNKDINVKEMKRQFEKNKKKLFNIAISYLQNSNDNITEVEEESNIKMKNINNQMISLSKENDELKQTNELLRAQVNEMTSHIKKIEQYEVDNANINQDLLTLSKKITQISSKIKLPFTNPLSLVASPNDSIRKSNFNITDDIPIRELIKKTDTE